MTKKDQVTLEAITRETRGKQAARELRRDNLVPAVVYGEGKSALAVQVPAKELSRALHTKAGGNVLIQLRLSDGGKKSDSAVLIKELQYHPVSHQIIHVDFHRVSLSKRITVAVGLAFKGEPEGVRMEGGVLEHLRWELEVECLPTEIPSGVPVDVSTLKLGETLFAKQVSLPAGVRLVTDPELPVASCQMPKVEEAAPAGVEEAAPTEPEVLKQKKPEEIAAEEAAKEEKKEKAPSKEKAPPQEKGEKKG